VGYTATIRGAQCGLKVTLVEDGSVAGTCLNDGRIPSKVLLVATGLVHDAGTTGEMGIYVEPYIDMSELGAWKDGVVDRLVGGIERLCEANDSASSTGSRAS